MRYQSDRSPVLIAFLSVCLFLIPGVLSATGRIVLFTGVHDRSHAHQAPAGADSLSLTSDGRFSSSRGEGEDVALLDSVITDACGHEIEYRETDFSGAKDPDFLDPGVTPLLIILTPLNPPGLEEEHMLGSYLRAGGAVLLVAGTCLTEEPQVNDAMVLNGLVDGLSGEGLETGIRFESGMIPATHGTVSSAFVDDPIVRGPYGEVKDVVLPTGFALDVDSSLNPSARAFAVELPSGDKWSFLAAAVIGSGRFAAVGAGGVLMRCTSQEEEANHFDRQSAILVKNLLSWLLAEREHPGEAERESSGVVVSEIMWGGDPHREFIELFNRSDREVNLEGWTITDGEDVHLLRGVIAAQGYYLLEYDEQATPVMADEVYGNDAPFLTFDDDGDRLSLLDRLGDIVALVNRDETPWPAGFAEGQGASMELIDEGGGYGDLNWRSSVGGEITPNSTPRAVNSTKVITPFIPDFRASIIEGNILLEWRVSGEVIVSHFNLYRSIDASLNPLESTGTFVRMNSLPMPPDSTCFFDTEIDSSMTYHYLLGVLPENGIEMFSEPVTISLRGLDEPRRYSVSMDQNFPNPFNPNTEIRFQIEDIEGSSGPIAINMSIFSPRGHLVRRLYERQAYPGSFSVRWDGRDDNGEEVGSGAYYYQLLVTDAGTGQVLVRLSRKMVLMR